MTSSLALISLDPRARAFELVREHGRDTVSFQGLETGFRYWFDGDGACVAYVDTGGAWVAAGGPIAPPARAADVAQRFADAARVHRRRACFFAAESTLVDLGLPSLLIGEQPVWDAARWDDVLAGSSSLRYQVRRARNKGVNVRHASADELARGTELRDAVDQLGKRWQASQRMPPMEFLVTLEPLGYAAERAVLVAEHRGAVVGMASCVPVYARRRLFVEDFVRSPDAPNGTVELLVDAAMRAAVAAGRGEVTLGLAPLAGGVARWLRLARWLGTPLYDFAGLRAFKAKLRPHAWEPVYLCVPPGASKLFALRDSLRAFAGGSLLAFGARTVFRSKSAS